MRSEAEGATAARGRWELPFWHFLLERSSKLHPLLKSTTLPLPFHPAPGALVQHRYFLDIFPLANREIPIPFICSFIHQTLGEHLLCTYLGIVTSLLTWVTLRKRLLLSM